MSLLQQRMPDYLKQYLAYMKTIRGRSDTTVDEYFLTLKMFLQYSLKEKNSLDGDMADVDITAAGEPFIQSIVLMDCYNFLMYASNERKNNAASIARKVACLRSFFTYLHKKAGIITVNPVVDLDSPRQRKALPKYMDFEESVRLLASVDSRHPERDYCIITLFLNCGMRISELVKLNLNDYNASQHTLRLLGKGNKERIVYTNAACDRAISDWLSVRPVTGLNDPQALFVSAKKNRISVKTIQWMLPKFFKAAGLDGKGLSAHKLRHTAATLMYRSGEVNLKVLQEILGHESLATTEIYTHIVSEDKQSAAEANPLAAITPKKSKKTTPAVTKDQGADSDKV